VKGSPSALNGVVYVGGGDGRVYGLNGSLGVVNGVPPGGVLYRSAPLGASVVSTPAVLAQAGVWVESADGRVARLSLDLTAVRWQSPGGAGTDASVYTDGRTVFAASADGTVLAFNAANGEMVWSRSLAPGAAAATPMGDGAGTLYVTTSDNRLWAMDALSGTPRPGYENGRALPEAGTPGAPLVARDGEGEARVYVPGGDRFTEIHGDAARQHDLGRALGSHGSGRFRAPALAAGYVVATNDNGQLIGWKRRVE